MSESESAEQLGVTQSCIRDLMRGDIDQFSLDTRARADIEARVRAAAGQGDQVALRHLQPLLAEINARIDSLGQERDRLLAGAIGAGAETGVAPFAGAGVDAALFRVADAAARHVRTFVAADGLQLYMV